MIAPLRAEEPEYVDPLIFQFGNSDLVRYAREPHRMQELLRDGEPVTANALLAAIHVLSPASLELLLLAGVSPDMRLPVAREVTSNTGSVWYKTNISPVYNPRFIDDWYPIQHAAQASTRQASEKRHLTAIMTMLLDHGADLYALFRQPFFRIIDSPYPGEPYLDQKVSLVRRRVKFETSEDNTDGPAHREVACGVRCVIHAMLEDGALFRPILDHTSTKLDLEHRDPQGRTLLLSACRSSLGADAVVDCTMRDAVPFHDPALFENPLDTTAPTETLFHALERLGADLLATDYSDKHVLHHLLEAQHAGAPGGRAPVMRESLRYAMQTLPSLVNQPDKHGTYPLHAAFQCRRRYPHLDDQTKLAGVDTVVDDVLAAGADPLATDGHGNTALHYIADDGLAERVHGSTMRRYFLHFLDQGVDVNARNNHDRTALDVFLDNDGTRVQQRECWNNPVFYPNLTVPTTEAADAEAMELFDRAGVKWTEQDPQGRTGLHLVAVHPIEQAASRTRYLLSKGVDRKLIDNQGKTALDVAIEHGNEAVVAILNAADSKQ